VLPHVRDWNPPPLGRIGHAEARPSGL